VPDRKHHQIAGYGQQNNTDPYEREETGKHPDPEPQSLWWLQLAGGNRTQTLMRKDHAADPNNNSNDM